MKYLKQIGLVLLGSVLFVAVISVVSPTGAHALIAKLVVVTNSPSQPVPVVVQNPPSASPTLLGPTKASQLVTLTSTRTSCPGAPTALVWDQRVNADGTVTPFTIPSGMVLVLTGLDWRQGLPLGANRAEEIFVFRSMPSIGGTLIDSVSGASDGETGANVAVSGVVVKAALQLCWQVNSGNFGSSDAVLHGFLALDQ